MKILSCKHEHPRDSQRGETGAPSLAHAGGAMLPEVTA
jgi:hypothetical protein